MDTITRREEQMESLLDEAGQKILSEMSDAQQTADHITALENFIMGFRLGVRIMAECMDSGDGMVRKRDDGRWEGRIVMGHEGLALPKADPAPRRVLTDQDLDRFKEAINADPSGMISSIPS